MAAYIYTTKTEVRELIRAGFLDYGSAADCARTMEIEFERNPHRPDAPHWGAGERIQPGIYGARGYAVFLTRPRETDM